jgi:arylsulfate sulfotransferase
VSSAAIPLLAVGCTPAPLHPFAATVEIVQPSPLAPYARLVVLSFDRDVTVAGTATDGRHTLEITAGPFGQDHDISSEGPTLGIPLVGLYADARWVVALTATDEAGREQPLPPVVFQTAPLPELFPRLELRVAEASPAPTLLPLDGSDLATWLVVVDGGGEVAWLLDGERGELREAHPSRDGSGVQLLQDDELVEIDWLGRERRRLSALAGAAGVEVAEAERFHHEFQESSRGTWLTLDKVGVRFEAFPVSYETPLARVPALVQGDRLLELDPDDGAVLRTWSAAEHLDPLRIGWDSLERQSRGYDWLHANAIAEAAGGWIVSLRHQDAVVRVDEETGEVRWILANPDNWTLRFQDRLLAPVGDLAWAYHQHGAQWRAAADGREQVLVLDNGNGRSSPWTDQPYVADADNASRVVAYEVDPETRTVTEVFSAAPEPPVFAPLMGDADWLDGGDVLATFASVAYEGHEPPRAQGRSGMARVVQFSPDGRVVWDLDVWGALGEPGWRVYRAERLEDWLGAR